VHQHFRKVSRTQSMANNEDRRMPGRNNSSKSWNGSTTFPPMKSRRFCSAIHTSTLLLKVCSRRKCLLRAGPDWGWAVFDDILHLQAGRTGNADLRPRYE